MRNASSVPFVGIAWLLSSILSGCAISLETSADRNPVDSRTPKADASALIAAQHKDFPQLDQTSAISDAVVEPSQPALAIRPAKQIATKTPPVIAIPPAVPNAVEAPADRGTRSSRVSNSQFVWEPEKAPRGPMVLVVSLADQQAYVYRNGVRIGQTNVSTGRAGYETPTGVFSILQKKKRHVSNLYEGAKMPYMQRLTWDGIALHGGHVPDRPASHGCIRLPHKFARLLYKETNFDTKVVIAESHSGSAEIDYL